MTLDEWLDEEYNGEVRHDVLLSEWQQTKAPRGTFKNFCLNKLEDWLYEE